MSWSCSIRVVDGKGDGVSGVDVALYGAGVLAGTLREVTDDDGWAEFELPAREYDFWDVESICLDNHEVCGAVQIDDGEALSFAVE